MLFAVGSVCFLVGPFPRFEQAVGSTVDDVVFFVGSLFFTSAAALQLFDSIEEGSNRLDLWSSLTQLAGAVLFNINTFRAMVGDPSYDRQVWRPDAVGSAVNLLGCIAFGVAAVGAYLVPSTGQEVSVAAADLGTSFGALCFLVGALLLLPVATR